MKINGYDFKVGADPEFFVKRAGKLVSAYNLVPGNKEHPYKVKNGAVQVDGMALEFNIDPAETYTQFEDNMSTVLDQIIKMVPGYEIFVEPVADFGLDYINKQPKEAAELGCSPDFNAYTRGVNPRPDANTPFRTASGHVHIGWTKEPVDINDPGHLEACYALVKMLDLYLGVPSLAWDREDRRRQLYGAAGAFRPKPYGLEYRVLSNKWIMSPVLRKCVYENTILAIKKTFDNPDYSATKFYNASVEDIVNKKVSNWMECMAYTIDYADVPSAKKYRLEFEQKAA